MTVHASSDKELETIYHVYIDGKHIGKIDDKSVVQDIALKKLNKEEEKYDNMDLVIKQSIDIVSEKVFDPSYNNDKVRDALKDMITVEAKGYAITVGDDLIGNFANEDIAEEVLRAYQLEYVTASELEEVEEAKADKQSNLEVGETVIQDVTFSKDVAITEKNSDPEDMIDLEQGVELLSKGTVEDKKHTVVSGDVFESIAEKYDLTTDELEELNPDLSADSILQIDDKLNVTELEPYTDVIVEEEALKEKTIAFETEIIESDDLYKGEEEVEQAGEDGEKEVHYHVEKVNGVEESRDVIDETIIEEPVDEIIIKGTKVIPSRGSGSLSWPVDGGYVSSEMGERWGRMHRGIDIARPNTRAITAADHGVVESVGMEGSYGNKIVIDHNNGMKTIYAHLESMDVSVGETVEKGMEIGVMGSTGNSTGIHLHFEVHQDGQLKNPLDYF